MKTLLSLFLSACFIAQVALMTGLWEPGRFQIPFFRPVGPPPLVFSMHQWVPQEQTYVVLLRDRESKKIQKTFESSAPGFSLFQNSLSYWWYLPPDKRETFLTLLCPRLSVLMERAGDQVLEVWLSSRNTRTFEDFSKFSDEEKKQLVQKTKLVSC